MGISDNQPDVIQKNDYFIRGVGIDPAKYLIRPGVVTGLNKHSAGQWANARPYISNGNDIFVWPVGAEGFSDAGQATLGLHKYIGAKDVDGIVIHAEESRITLTGTFPGLTSVANRIDLRNLLRQTPKGPGLILWIPGIYEQEQYVLAESWNFDHAADDRSHSIDYSVTFVRIGTKKQVSDPTGTIPPPQPGQHTTPGGSAHRIFTVKANVRTLRAIAKVVYKNPHAWTRLVTLNNGQINRWKHKHPKLPMHEIPTHRWPLGTKFHY